MGSFPPTTPDSSNRVGSWGWIGLMAWRDSRGQRRKLLLFTLCIVFGIGALVAIRSFRHNLESAIDEHAQTLLGSDLRLSSLRPFDDETEAFMASLNAAETAQEVRFRSMAYFTKQGTSRLVQVRAVEGDFPFYGEMETIPADLNFQLEEKPLAVVEESLMQQFGARRGDTLKLGRHEFVIAGELLRIPGETEIRGIFAPRVYIDKRYLGRTGLVQRGSLTSYRVHFRFSGGYTEEIKERIEEAKEGSFADKRVRVDTVERRKRNLGRRLDNMYDFLNLVGFIALFLGGLGVAGAVQVYLTDKLNTVALLRCLGASVRQAFWIYLIQVLSIGIIGSLLGALLGVSVQFLLPAVLESFLPFNVAVFISWGSIFLSLVFGLGVTLLFSFIPLLTVRSVTPLRALRVSFEESHLLRKDPYFWLVVGIIAALVLFFSLAQTSKFVFGLAFAGALAVSLLLLGGLAWGLRHGLKRFFPKRWPYLWRQGLSNLFRPHNRTLFLTITLGMGTFLIYTIYLTQSFLLQQVEIDSGDKRPNMVLFDIQPDQIEDVERIVEDAGYTVWESVPMVVMRLSEINGRTVREIKNDPNSKTDGWTLRWEYRTTFRSELIDTEEIIEGNFTPRSDGSEPVPISIEKSIAEEMHVFLGDSLLFDVQGIPISTVIDSVREVDWAQLRPNFYMLFPEGVLEEAPAFYALVTKVPDRTALASLQQKIIETHPNVSAVDLSLVLETLSSILDRVAFVIRFMAVFTVATGLMVLIGAVVTSRYQRIQESVLLCTLGATGGMIRRIMTVEYLLLGLLAGLTGSILAVAASWGLAFFVFELPFTISWIGFLGSVLTVTLLTLGTGLINSRGIASHPPLAILRAEG